MHTNGIPKFATPSTLTVIPAAERGHTNLGWLDSRHVFSFGSYYNTERMGFGALRVVNDDIVYPGGGFGTHPHRDMEIVSIPLGGGMEHKDSMGNIHVLRPGDVQVMTAGSGITHSEYNHSKEEEVLFLQIWILPRERNLAPRYDQKTFSWQTTRNGLRLLVSPDGREDSLWIHQDALVYGGALDAGSTLSYDLREARRGLYLYLLEGGLHMNGTPVKRRDSLCLEGKGEFHFTADQTSVFVLIELPM